MNTIKLKVGTTRKSQACPAFCKSKGCYDRVEPITINEKKYNSWVVYCKALNRIGKQAIGKANKIINKS